MAQELEEDQWAKLSIEEKFSELGFDAEGESGKFFDATFSVDQRERLHGALDMLAGAISVGHTTLEKTAASDDCPTCKEVTDVWNELLKVEG